MIEQQAVCETAVEMRQFLEEWVFPVGGKGPTDIEYLISETNNPYFRYTYQVPDGGDKQSAFDRTHPMGE